MKTALNEYARDWRGNRHFFFLSWHRAKPVSVKSLLHQAACQVYELYGARPFIKSHDNASELKIDARYGGVLKRLTQKSFQAAIGQMDYWMSIDVTTDGRYMYIDMVDNGKAIRDNNGLLAAIEREILPLHGSISMNSSQNIGSFIKLSIRLK